VLQLELSEQSPNTPGDRRTGEAAHFAAGNQSPGITQADDPLSCERTTTHGSAGEHLLQAAYGTTARADRFYQDQLLDHLNQKMTEFTGRMEMAFVATSDASGECDCSLRTGPAGFIQVLNEKTLAYPEYRGNGVMASLGNISENAQIGVLMVDFVADLIGLHVNGTASIVEDSVLRGEYPDLPVDAERGRTPERWVLVHVVEAYVHCRKHIPRMVPVDRLRGWGTDDPLPKGGDYFEAKTTPRADAVVSSTA
jgi:predicted pyridoxine 5'-phosphate oxidase superfamily flavin-nucleotide-binding protein